MSEKEKMLAGKLYDPSDEELLKLRLNARLLTEELNATSVEFHQKRVEIIRHLFGTPGDNIHIESYFNCDYGSNIHVGDNFYANFGCVILDVAEVKFGKNCLLAPESVKPAPTLSLSPPASTF
jgi:maltose O-acetyltransferase|nr:maltose acetyltransferase domain-containing protein [Halomonas sp.]